MTEDYMEMIEACEREESKLTDWERNFIDSMRRQLENGDTLSVNQSDKLTQIWENAIQ